ncbi:hypothetical protein DZD33_00695 [Campylobacter hepaticus]|uniref:Highly acidic protein n=1 Tax=Campylobacter hepaticus TaxID=1813019 RepID=A0A6A7JTJ8_9BACT|nr:hypothetical protein [Campylobacter hepaticus]AXP08343.1 hypothetical protein A2J15_001095 [Campylobacter hepaticus]MDX2322768.1 hypothetical protein [Campylobacter hepaticus]MDX2332199.1 hypothetical protein [Campylobacter hepaticus]MDX2408916.1 hypothetical protein [Campylobacter hepaticus]MPV53583.1 hypothetical protein [Campylobacter hepaticus]
MKILLLNENPVVSRLVSLSAKKMSYDFEELSAYDENLPYYDVIVVDSDTPAPLKILKEKCEKLIFLAPRNQNIDIDAQILQKPFLPTDFLNLFNNEEIKEYISVVNESEDTDLHLEDIDDSSLDINLDNDLEDLSLDSGNSDALDTLDQVENEVIQDDNLKQEDCNQKQIEDDLKQDLVEDEKEQNIQTHELEDLNNLENKDEQVDEKELLENVNNFDDILVVEEQEKEIDFDDIPKDAEFLGQIKENNAQESLQDFSPIVEEEITKENQESLQDFAHLSTQEQIKEELAELDELDYDIEKDNGVKVLEDFKDDPILDKELGLSEEEVIVPNLNISDFDILKESEIQEALGEAVVIKDEKDQKSDMININNNNEAIVNELTQSIAGAITSSIKDDTLKAALKGMNMNINIHVSFNED